MYRVHSGTRVRLMGGGGGVKTKPRIEIEFVWTHAHCNHVKTTLKWYDIRANSDEMWCVNMSDCPSCADRDLDPLARPCPVWNIGDSLFAEGSQGVRQSFLAIAHETSWTRSLFIVHDYLLVTWVRHWRLNWVKKSFGFGSLWMFLISMQVSGSPFLRNKDKTIMIQKDLETNKQTKN